uniref:Reverse transcriptase zinc-binding domain-containing protein n=1 Tax=Cannabis sativa TaxID=3483 RepID=A0A803P3Y9_CANSA
MNIFLLPKSIIKEVDKFCLWFLWGNNGSRSNFHLTAWSKVCLPKIFGGLDFGDGTNWNKAMLGKYIWAISHQQDTLWVKWISSIYLKGRNFWSYQLNLDSSWYWRKLYHFREHFSQHAIDTAGHGGKFKIGRFYSNQIELEKVKNHNFVWNNFSVPKHRFIVWQAIYGKLLTRDNLRLVIPSVEGDCPVCEEMAENHCHLFLRCEFSLRVVKLVQDWLGRSWPLDYEAWKLWIESLDKGFSAKVVAASCSAVIYHIWLNRNVCVFNSYSYIVYKIINRIKKEVIYRVNTYSHLNWKDKDRKLFYLLEFF